MLKQLGTPPSPRSSLYLQADFVELSCLANDDNYLSRTELLQWLNADADINDYNDFNELSDSYAENSDLQIQELNEYFAYIRYRSEAFATSYPFLIDDESTSLQLKEELNEHQMLYLFLLLASSLRNFDKRASYRISSDFEAICATALRRYIGNRSEVRIFGKGTHSDYTGKKFAKLSKLANDIGDALAVTEEDFGAKDSGDAGLDLVAWLPTYDQSKGRLLVFAQCACGKDWEDKQSSSGFDSWNPLIHLSTYPVNAMFIPYCFRDTGGNWYASHKIRMTVLIDRFRLMKLLEAVQHPLQELSTEVRKILEDTIRIHV